jgi:hypothetical protein
MTRWSTKKKNLDIHKLVEDYRNGKGIPTLAAKYKVSNGVIANRLHNCDTIFRSAADSARKYDIDENYFETINSNEKAYILGLLFADGYNHVNKNTIVLQLSSPDEYILSLIGNKIYRNKDYILKKTISDKFKTKYALRIYSKKLSKDLSNLGCVQKKSLVLKYPKINPIYNQSFIRGYFDGDGCISINKSGPQVTLLGTKDMLTNIQEILKSEKIVKGVSLFKRGNIYSICYGGEVQCCNIGKYLYKNSEDLKLIRKFEKFQTMQRWVP